MKKLILAFVCSQLFHLISNAQPGPAKKPPVNNGKKYGSLLWEITGKGLKKPSYLFGTMHVSDKLVFHLGDSFYDAIKSVDVVALETNPDNWQDDYNNSIFLRRGNPMAMRYMFMMSQENAADKMNITSLSMDDYQEAIKAALAVEPSLVNGLLYRTYGSRMADFEEDTYLDMYIFQTGKKLGKKLAGVENFKESEKLVMEAYRDMMNDENRKRKSFDLEGMYSNPKKMEEAYRKGDLDVLDSLDALEVESDAFQEKFLYKRNEIQAKNIDSILKRSTVFAAVGAAHLPGKRGVIEMLREMGYQLKPVTMDDRNSKQKEVIDRTRHITTFVNQKSDDGFFEVSIPGKKFYTFTEWTGMDIRQYADMANGSYYMTVRIKTNSDFRGHSPEMIHKKIDSLLYENIPGKIIKKTPITRNGYKGWEILNRIRRGDQQRYNIYVTPYEIVVFKTSGNGDYVTSGSEAQQFFNSVKLKEYKEATWSSFKPATGGFSVQVPYTPSLLRDETTGTPRLEYAAHDGQNSYLIMQNNFPSFDYAAEDSFELGLMDESYAYSAFIDKKLNSKYIMQDGYRGLEAAYKHKDGMKSSVRYFIRGPIYYTVAVRYKQENDNAKKFLHSFSLQPFIYPETKTRTDTSLRFTVQSPFIDEFKKDNEEEAMTMMMSMYGMSLDDEDDDRPDYYGNTRSTIIGNDTLGEKVYVTYEKPGNYGWVKDSAAFWSNNFHVNERFALLFKKDSSFITRLDKRYELPGGVKCRDLQLTDTGSSRLIMTKYIYKNGHVYTLQAVTDTLSKSLFLSTFFNTFTPADTLKGNLFVKKTEQFFTDYFSSDSATQKKARKSLSELQFEDSDAPLLKMAIERINKKTRNYVDVKNQFISELGALKDPGITPFLEQLYWKVKDTVSFQNSILDALLEQKTKASFIAFKDLILTETPVETSDNRGYNPTRYYQQMMQAIRTNRLGKLDYAGLYDRGWSGLYDTLSLAKIIFPDILQLMNIEDYKTTVTQLLVTMVDSGQLKHTDYEAWFPRLYLDAKQLMKKQTSAEDADNIERESRKDKKKTYYSYYYDMDDAMEEGNEELVNSAILMMPFYDTNPGIQDFFGQLLKTRDRQLYYDVAILMLRNKKPVPDSFFTHYAALDQYRSDLYSDLAKIKMTAKFPAKYAKQEEMARSLFLSGQNRYGRPDSVTYVDKLPITWEGKKGWVHFFKYKEEKDDNFWYLASIGMQPESADSVDADNIDFKSDAVKLKTGQSIREEMDKMLREMINSKKPGASEFYEARQYNPYKMYLSDMVKGNRFND